MIKPQTAPSQGRFSFGICPTPHSIENDIRLIFGSAGEAVLLANDTPYGLAVAVWTKDSARMHRLGRKIEACIQWMNCWFLRDLRTPFGGSKPSGIGREGGVHSLEFYTDLRNICVKL